MPTIVLMRHSRADRPAGCADADRPLSSSGWADAAIAAELLAAAHLEEPVLALVSPARRTQQTWEAVSSGLPQARPLIEPTLYEADVDEMMTLAAERATSDDECRTVIVVGHNPTVHECALALLHASPGERHPLSRKFPTSAIAQIRVKPGWHLTRGAGELVDFWIPRANRNESPA